MRLSEQSREALEWPAFLKLLAQGAATDAGRRRLLELTPTADSDRISSAIERGREVEELLEDGALVPSQGLEFLPALERLEHRPFEIEGAHLLAMRDLLRTTMPASDRIRHADCPALAALTDDLPDGTDLLRRLEKVLDARGRVRDDASPRLAALRRRGQQVRQKIYGRLERYSSDHAEDVAGDTATVREDRLVVLVRSGAKKQGGLVHGKSGSGQSVYFEPLDVVSDNNELREVHGEDAAERQRLLRELIEACLEGRALLSAHLAFVAELDDRQAAVRWAKIVGAAWVLPAADAICRLVEARHPLLDPKLAALRRAALDSAGHEGEVVPLSLDLVSERRVLVVTGPNAGGKTVALKTLGLLAAAAHCGLPIPADADSQLPLLDGIVAIVGDEQDLLADRSTFSGRLLRLKEAWEESRPGVLLLLDELGSGTDPEEGAALGIALIEGLLERGALAVVSSHLVRVATAALELEGAGCAAMAFDPDTGSPTYRLVPGTPGSSEALALARRLELPDEWLERAESLLGSEHGRLQRLLAEVEAVRDELSRAAGEAATESSRLARERSRVAASGAALEKERKAAAKVAKAEVDRFRRDVRTRLRSEVKRMKEAFAAGRKRNLVVEAEQEIFREAPFLDLESEGGPVVVGGQVRHRALGWEGRLASVAKGRAEVLVGGKRLRCAVDDLEGLPEARPSSAAKRVSVVRADAPALEREINLRGERVESALEKLDGYLDRSLLESLTEVRIVHGHGTGQLKRAVRELLDRHPAIVRWRPGGRGEGGDGATVVTLAE